MQSGEINSECIKSDKRVSSGKQRLERIFEKKLSIHRRNKRSVQRDGDFSKKWHKCFPDTNIDSRDRYIKCIHLPALIAWRDKYHLNRGTGERKKAG